MIKVMTILGLIAVGSLCIAQESPGSKKILLTERVLKNLIEETPPSVMQIEASFLTQKQQYLAQDDALGFNLVGKGTHYQSDERLLSRSDGGVTSHASHYSLGIVKPTRYGIDMKLEAFGNKVSNAFITDSATTGVSLSLSMDLYQNFLGRQTDNNLEKSALSVERAKLEKKINLKTFESNIRKLYWALVANQEQKKFLEKLVTLAEKQYKEAKKRRSSGVADTGEVARYHSQWTSRQSSLLSLEYRRGEILKTLKELLPSLENKEIELGTYSVEKTVVQVLSCSARISSHPTAPLEFTPYDEIVEFLNREQELQEKIVRTYDDPQVKLVGEYASVGRDFGYDNAQQDFSDDARARKSIGLELTIPFGGRKSATREVSEELARNQYLAQSRGKLAKIQSFHTETAKIINILRQVVRNQKETNKYLGESLKVSQRKYNQARISLQELISERDALLQTSLSEIETNLTIIDTLMDYFSIYTDIPCELNRI
ncbi:MAG: TolC family protein [Halobacteriovoraceae bacterium]|nr:TolC family protein [Halobacteriovoraceae bacterium]MCB9095284.1 TolC family protein [Halobacteriovoraceae bacterium]